MAAVSKLLNVALIAVIAIYTLNLGLFGFLVGPFDYDHLSAYYDLAARFWLTSPGVPHYNPYLCGGRTLGGDPQIPIFHPLVLLIPLLGPVWLLRLEILGQLALGTYGLARVLKHFNVGSLGISWGLYLFLAGGGVVARVMVGHVTLGFYLLFPLFLWLSYRLSAGPLNAKLLASYWALFIYAGMYKPNFLILGVPPLLIEALTRSALQRKPRIALAFVGGVAACALVNATTYLPAWRYFSDFPRTDGSAPFFVPPSVLMANLLLPLKAIPKALYGDGFLQRHEYNVFLGPLALWIAYLGWRRKSPKVRAEKSALLVFAIFSTVVGLGSPSAGVDLLPYSWMRALWPGFQSLRVPPRFWFALFLCLVVFSAMGFEKPRSRSGFLLWLALGIVPLFLNASVNLFKTTVLAEGTQWSFPREYPDSILLTHNHPDRVFAYTRRGLGIIDCVDNVEVKRPADLISGPMLGTERGVQAKWLAWNRFEVRGTIPSGKELAFNMNHSSLWRVARGEAVLISGMGERLRLRSPGVTVDSELVFEQPLAREAMWISIISGLLFIGFLITARLRSVP